MKTGEWRSRTNRELEQMSKGENIVKWIKGQSISQFITYLWTALHVSGVDTHHQGLNDSRRQQTQLTSARSCNYSCTSSWWWVSTPKTCRAVYRYVINWIQSHLVGQLFNLIHDAKTHEYSLLYALPNAMLFRLSNQYSGIAIYRFWRGRRKQTMNAGKRSIQICGVFKS